MKKVLCILGILAITAAFCFLLVPQVEVGIVENTVEPPAGVTLEQWVDNFKHWAKVSAIVSGAFSLVWYAFGQWIFKVDRWTESDKRWFWFLLFLPSVFTIILGIWFTRHAQQGIGVYLAYGSYVLNGLGCYYLATAMCSPSSFKYTPLLASEFWRRLW